MCHSKSLCLPFHPCVVGGEPLAGAGPCSGALCHHRAPRLWDLPGVSLPLTPDRDNDLPQGQESSLTQVFTA